MGHEASRNSQLRGIRAVVLVAALAFPATPLAAPDDGTWRVLLLGDDLTFPASIQQVEGLHSALAAGAGRPIELYQEALDVIRFPGTEDAQAELLREKYKDVPLALVIALGPRALAFALDHRAALPMGVPLMFFSVVADSLGRLSSLDDVSGVTIPFDLEGTLDLALRLHPERRQVAVVVGTSQYDHGWLDRALELFSRRDDVRVTFLTDRSLEEIERDVQVLPNDAFVLYLTVSADASGARVVSRDVVAKVAAAASVPVYTFFESNVGQGVVGGSAPSFAGQGRAAAALGIRLMNGDATARGHIEAGPGPRCTVDARALARWRIDEASLPPGCDIAFHEPSLWEQFGSYIVAGLAIIALQAGLIAALLLQRRRSRIAEAELSHERAVAAHAARLATLGELSATIAHEISQPLGAILSNADAGAMLLESDDPSHLSEARQIFTDIRRDDLRARDVVRRVRALAQHHALSLQPLDVNDVIEDTRRLVEADAARRGIAIELDLAPVPFVNGDRAQLQQVLINLMLNAMDAMTDSPPARRRLTVRTRFVEWRVEVCVSDIGPGIAADHQERLFESFFTTKAHGVGLGLAIVRSILESHAGNIRGANHANGAAFTFTLPALAKSPRDAASAPPQPAQAPT